MLQVEAVLSVGEIVLKPARTVALRVIDSAGRPVPLADVRTPDGVRTTTDAKGRAILDGIPAGEEVQIDVRARGFRNGKLTAAADKQAFELVLSRGVHVLASVIRAGTREPAGPGTVMIGNNGGRRMEQFDASGLIDLGGLDAGILTMEIRAAGATPLILPERTVRIDEEIDLGELQLPAGAAMTGRVLSRTDSAPIANARVKVLRRGPAGPVASFVMHDWVETTSADDGSFSVGGLQTGPQVMFVEATGFASRVVNADLAGIDTPLDLGAVSLDRGRELIVRCTPAPRCGSEARVLLAGSEFPWAVVSGAMQDGTAHVLPAPSGTATLRLLSNGRIVDERSVEISSQSETTTVEIKLLFTKVTGTVVSGGRPRAGGKIFLERAAGDSHVMPVYVETRTAEGQVTSGGAVTDIPDLQTADVDDRGRFAFAEVQPGAYRATARLEGKSSPPIPVAIPQGDDYDFTIAMPPGELRARVVDLDAAPVRRAIVEVRDSAGQQQMGITDDSGEFVLAGITPGHVVVSATQGDREGEAEAEVAPPRTATIEIVLRKKERRQTELAVVSPNGEPVAGAIVLLLGGGPVPTAVVTTDGNGIATFRLDHPITSAVAAYSPRYGWALMEARTLGAETASQVSLRMSDATGAFLVASAKPVNIEIYSPTGIPLSSALSMIGASIHAAPGSDLRVSGLPVGVYSVQAGGIRTTVAVEAGKETRVSIP